MSETFFLVEQAVFSANLARRGANGRNEAALLSATEGASRTDLDAALDWASRVETFDGGYDPRNLFFFPTPSGAFAIGRLTPAAPEEGEGAFYFQTFFVEENAFFQCGANPVALLHLALNTAKFALYRPGARLEAFRLEARAPWIDQEELRRTTERLGTRALTTLIQATLESKRSAFVADYNAFLVVAALFELTPLNWRPALTFAVGVRFRDDVALRLLGATVRRGDEPSFALETPWRDLRDVVENDDAYPIENAWAALVELALKSNRVDFLYERMATDFFLYRNLDDEARVASSEEVAALGLRWRFELESALRGEKPDDAAEFFDGRSAAESGDEEDDAARDDERSDETESFFDGEFEGGWRDSDGDERWRVDEADAETAETRPKPEDRVGPEFVLKVVEPTEAERAADAEAREREKSREKNASSKKNDNNLKKNGDAGSERRERPASLDEIFAGESFEDEWAATEKERGEKNGAKESASREPNGRSGEKKRGAERTERGEKKEKKEKEEALEALRQMFGGEKGVAGADGARRTAIAARFEEFWELLQVDGAFDAPPGLSALANWNAFLDERGAEALKRLGRATRRGDDGERNASDRDVRRLRLAPFAALSAEFPGWNEELRRFDALFDDACVGNDAAAETLRDFWRRWKRDLDEETVDRIRDAYEERLRGRLAAEGGGAVERTERLLAALAIYGALFLER